MFGDFDGDLLANHNIMLFFMLKTGLNLRRNWSIVLIIHLVTHNTGYLSVKFMNRCFVFNL